MLLLNADGWSVANIADILKCHEHTVRATLKRWQNAGLCGLWEKGGRGQKPTWQPSDLDYLVDCLESEERTYNSRQLAVKLAADRQVHLSPTQIRRLLKKELSMEAHPTEPSPASRPRRESSRSRPTHSTRSAGSQRSNLA